MKSGLIILLVVSCAFGQLRSSTWYSVLPEGSKFKLVEGKQAEGSLAWGIYHDDTFKDGWGKLSLYTETFQNAKVAMAAGFLEGALQGKYIGFHKTNFYDQVFGSQTIAPKIADFVNKQYKYTVEQTLKNYKTDAYWKNVGIFSHFFEGLVQGYNFQASDDQKLSRTDFLVLQIIGDIFDLKPALQVGNEPDWFQLSKEEFRQRFLENTHCSVLLKIKDDMSDVYIDFNMLSFLGHTSWNAGNVMLRTYKFYNFGEDLKLQMTSYPGLIYSLDDYYILEREDQKLYVTETSNAVFDKSIYANVTTQSLLCWQRILVANLMAKTGDEWTEIFSRYNSGTYNNQYMVIDTKAFNVGVGPQAGFLWIVEQMPSKIVRQDVTQVMVDQGNFWSSYNVPYFKEIFEYAGYDRAVEKMGDEWTWENAPRARIFRREQSSVQDFASYKKIMRYNKFQNDEESKGDPTNQIAARGDLYPAASRRSAFFAYDAKATTLLRIRNQDGLSDIQNGPTHDDQKPFKWSDFNFKNSHVGQPDLWNFDWITIQRDQ